MFVCYIVVWEQLKTVRKLNLICSSKKTWRKILNSYNSSLKHFYQKREYKGYLLLWKSIWGLSRCMWSPQDEDKVSAPARLTPWQYCPILITYFLSMNNINYTHATRQHIGYNCWDYKEDSKWDSQSTENHYQLETEGKFLLQKWGNVQYGITVQLKGCKAYNCALPIF